MNGYTGAADGFHVNVHLITQMELPNNRDTVLHFFEQMRKGFPELRHFFKRENGDLVLESEKERESHRWLAIQPRRLCSGQFNPETMDDAFRQHELVLDLAPHLLTISTLDCEALEIMYEFDFHYDGNHDEVVAEAIGVGHGLEGLFELPKSQVVKFEPSLILALDESGESSVPALDREPHECGTASRPRVHRRSDQRLLHSAAILGEWAGDNVSGIGSPAAANRRGTSGAIGRSTDREAAAYRPLPRTRLGVPGRMFSGFRGIHAWA